MKQLCIATLLIVFSTSALAGTPHEAIYELARMAHNASPTPALEQQVVSWYNAANVEDVNLAFQAFLFAQHIMPQLLEARDKEVLAETMQHTGTRKEMAALRRTWIHFLTNLLDDIIKLLTNIGAWVSLSGSQDNLTLQGLTELNAWIEQFNERQRVFRLTYARCVTPQTPGLGDVSAPYTSRESSPEPLPQPPLLWDKTRPVSIKEDVPPSKRRRHEQPAAFSI